MKPILIHIALPGERDAPRAFRAAMLLGGASLVRPRRMLMVSLDSKRLQTIALPRADPTSFFHFDSQTADP